jgi:phytoene dehydrogenase-like protein
VTNGSRYDAIVIGGGVGGLVAACYLARGGARTALLEAHSKFGGSVAPSMLDERMPAPPPAYLLYALDPVAAGDLRLKRHGLSYAVARMDTIALRTGREPMLLPGLRPFGRSGAGTLPVSDTAAFTDFRRTAYASARRLRPLWNAPPASLNKVDPFSIATIAEGLRFSARDMELLAQMTRLSAAGLLDRFIENDALKAALAFDAAANGTSPGEAGTALLLHWRYAQQSAGMQGAVSQPRIRSGSLSEALVRAADEFGVAMRANALVAEILVEHDRAGGVLLEGGEVLRASAVLSNLDARATLLGLVPPGALGFAAALRVPPPRQFGDAKIIYALDGLPPFVGLDQSLLRNRLIAAERPEAVDEAKGAAIQGDLPSEIVMEIVVPTAADTEILRAGTHMLDVRVPFVPLATDSAQLVKRVTAALECYAPGLKDRIVYASATTPQDLALRFGGTPCGLQSRHTRLLESYTARVATPIAGLFLCGESAEPCDAISGRAGRIAAGLALEEIRKLERHAA